MQFKLYEFQMKTANGKWITQCDNNNKYLMVWLNPDQFMIWEAQLDTNRRLTPVEGVLTISLVEDKAIVNNSYEYDDHRNSLKKLDFIRGYCKGYSRNTYGSEQLRQLVADEPKFDWEVDVYINGVSNKIGSLSELYAKDLYNQICKSMIGVKKHLISLVHKNKVVQKEGNL